MKVTFYALMLIINLTLIGCGNGGGRGGDGVVVTTPEFNTKIVSDPNFDGDIEIDPVTGVIIRQGNLVQSTFAGVVTTTQGNIIQSVFAGIDPDTGTETRAFLDFPLDSVPSDAVIVSAYLYITIDNIFPKPLAGTIPIRIDLVSFQQPRLRLIETDFDRILQPALDSTTILPPISQVDSGNRIKVDVTSFMVKAQRQVLLDFQVRILQDLGVAIPGLIKINDNLQAPQLEITYF